VNLLPGACWLSAPVAMVLPWPGLPSVLVCTSPGTFCQVLEAPTSAIMGKRAIMRESLRPWGMKRSTVDTSQERPM
jgi:hypothetical protein